MEVLGHDIGDLVERRQIAQGALGLQLARQRGHELLLRADAGLVAAVAEGRPGAQEGQGLLALDRGGACRQLEPGFGVFDLVVHADLHAAHAARQLGHGVEVGEHEVIDAQAGELIDRCHRAAGAAVLPRRVEHGGILRRVGLAGLRIRALGDLHHQIAGEGHDRDVLAVLRDVGQHHDVRLAAAVALLDLPVAGVALTGAGVRAEDEDVGGPGVLRLFLPQVQRAGDQVLLQLEDAQPADAHHDGQKHGRDDQSPAPPLRRRGRGTPVTTELLRLGGALVGCCVISGVCAHVLCSGRSGGVASGLLEAEP